MMAGNDNPGNPRRSEYCGGGLGLALDGEVFKYPIAAIVPLGATLDQNHPALGEQA